MKNKIKIAVVFGGMSKEHEISLLSAMSVLENLDKKKYNIIPVAITKKGGWLVGEKAAKYLKMNEELAGKENAISLKRSEILVGKKDGIGRLVEIKNKIDLVFPILYGPFGEDGKFQGLMDMLLIPYAFSGALSHALGMNKSKTKILAKNNNVPVPEEIKIEKKDKINPKTISEKIKFPVIVKPNELGSSVGITIARNNKQLSQAIKNAFKFGDEILIEKFIKGREFTVSVMEISNQTRALPVVEIIPKISEFYDYKAKYQEGGSDHICPAKISKALEKKIKKCAMKVFETIGCNDLARADFIFNSRKKEFYFIDLNTIPGMTKFSLAPEAARHDGLKFGKFLDEIIKNAARRIKGQSK